LGYWIGIILCPTKQNKKQTRKNPLSLCTKFSASADALVRYSFSGYEILIQLVVSSVFKISALEAGHHGAQL
jgi:hypothetical protein